MELSTVRRTSFLGDCSRIIFLCQGKGGFMDSMKFLDSVRHLLFLLLTALFLYYLYRSIKQYLSKPIGLAISEEEEDAFT